MIATLKHRGPDNQSVVVYERNNCMLAHARLSIIDLSEDANQPMEYGQLAVVFNGEIYNFKEIRQDLAEKGHKFNTQSDTEVILHAYQEWGNACVDHFIGMFAFCILDRAANRLLLFRDRAGVKPLYFYACGTTFLFASELKAFYEYPGFRREINMAAVALYFRYGYIPAPVAIYRNTQKLQAGHYLVYDISNRTYSIHRYWNVFDFYRMPQLDISYEEAKDELERLLVSAYNYRMVSDVPVGVFLSGGYDSIGVTALLQKDRTEKLKTFTIGFDIGNNEAPVAKAVAKHLGTDHTEYICTAEDCKRILPDLPFYYDEPFSDNSAVPTVLVSRLAREKVKVALSADGGDEAFSGYNSYGSLSKTFRYLHAIERIRSCSLSACAKMGTRVLPPYSFLREKVECFAKLLVIDADLRLSTAFEYGGSLMESMFNRIVRVEYPQQLYALSTKDFHDSISIATAMDYSNYMANDILVKVDRAAMSTSLESREPLLDHRIIEFAARLPQDYKFGKGVKKCIYKDIVTKYVPHELVDRPKTGFSMPIAEWLKGDLRYLLDEHVNESLDNNIFRVDQVLRLKKIFLDGKLGHEEKVMWRILSFQLWYERNVLSK